CCDPDGTVWAGSNSRRVKRFSGLGRPSAALGVAPIGPLTCYSILRDRRGLHWFTSNVGVTRFDGQTWTQLTYRDGLPSDETLQIVETEDGHFWFTTAAGLVRYRPRVRQPPAPTLRVQTDTVYTNLASLPLITSGARVTLAWDVVDPE